MILCAGISLVDCIITRQNSNGVAEDISLSPGGDAFNEAIWLSSLGEKVFLSSAIGNDFAGGILKKYLSIYDIALENRYFGKTPVSILTVDEAGERKSTVSKVHNLYGYQPSFPDDQEIFFVTIASLFRPPFLNPEISKSFATEAKKISGVKLLADTKLPKGTVPDLSDYKDTLAMLDYITPNEQEAYYYTHKNTPDAAAEVFRSFGVKNIIVKLGSNGCFVLSENGDKFSYPAYNVKCIDGIGAGDAFNAGLIYQLNKNQKLFHAVKFASACAAMNVMERGAISAATSADNVSRFISEQG